MQPYFSNSTEAARGFRDLGMIWEALGRKKGNAELTAWGQRLVREAALLSGRILTPPFLGRILAVLLEVMENGFYPAESGVIVQLENHPAANATRRCRAVEVAVLI